MYTNFGGQTIHSIDTKGRITIPSKYRKALGDRCIVARGFDGNLDVYSVEGWDKRVEIIINSKNKTKEKRQLQRILFSNMIVCSYDKQGRILISSELRTIAGFEKEIVIAGVGEHIELWSKVKWDSFINVNSDEFSELADKFFNESE